MYYKERFETYLDVDEMLDKYYNYDETYRKCSQCPGFGETWACPDFNFDPKDYWLQFSRFHFIVDRISNEGASTVAEAQDRLFSEKKIHDEEMLAMEEVCPGSKALAAQECTLCKKCARLSGHPCVHPDKMRYALESLGMLAVKMVKDCFGFDILWSDGTSIPEYYLLVGGILEK